MSSEDGASTEADQSRRKKIAPEFFVSFLVDPQPVWGEKCITFQDQNCEQNMMQF